MLVALDSYKLIPFRSVVLLVALGSAVALLCLVLNPFLLSGLALTQSTYARYVAPPLEEALKGVAVVFAIASRRIGFLVDAAIWGFAIGAGFAAVENVHFFLVLGDPDIALWIIRGFGTAVMHGGATAILAVSSKQITDRFDSAQPQYFLPGLAVASLIHSLYNHFFLSPGLSALALLIVLPLAFTIVFRVSENATQNWLGAGFDTDQELLRVIKKGQISQTRVGRYLLELKEHFRSEVVADMFCLIRIHVELSIKAKGILLMRKAGFSVEPDAAVTAQFEELRYLEKTVGKTGLIALHPILHVRTRELWQLHMLGRNKRRTNLLTRGR